MKSVGSTLLFALLAAALSACKIEIVVPEGGAVVSESGAHLCEAGEVCRIDVLDLFFDETFSGAADEGNAFNGWLRRHRGLCGGSLDDCRLFTAGFDGNAILLALLESDEVFFLQPLFEREPGPLFNVRYCEVLVAALEDGGIVADVYGTQGLNLCPQELLEALDIDAIAEQFGAARALLNGPRFWVLDAITRAADDAPAAGSVLFGDLEMQLLASVALPLAQLEGDNSPYQIAEVARDTVWHYLAGRRVYELTDPEGNRFLMQSFSRIVDEDQTLADLASLGERLDLPRGWSFATYLLEDDVDLPSLDGLAEVIVDDLLNTYQRIPTSGD